MMNVGEMKKTKSRKGFILALALVLGLGAAGFAAQSSYAAEGTPGDVTPVKAMDQVHKTADVAGQGAGQMVQAQERNAVASETQETAQAGEPAAAGQGQVTAPGTEPVTETVSATERDKAMVRGTELVTETAFATGAAKEPELEQGKATVPETEPDRERASVTEQGKAMAPETEPVSVTDQVRRPKPHSK